MTQDFPDCAKCGAAPASREDEYCRFCSAPLPWSEFDLRSRRVVVLVSSHTMQEALNRVERSDEFLRANLALKNRRSSKRTRRRRVRERANRRYDESGFETTSTDENAAVLMLLLACAVFIGAVNVAGMGWFGFLLVAVFASGMAIWGSHRASTTEQPKRRSFSPKRRAVLAAGIVELGAPRPRSRRDGTLVRDVRCKLPGQRERKFVADVHLDLHAGDVGIVHARGKELSKFERMEHVEAEAGSAAR